MSPPLHEVCEELSREVALALDASGVVTWADARAERVLGDIVGKKLESFATPGTESKVGRLTRELLAGSRERLEVSLVAKGVPATFAFRGKRVDGGIAMLGLHVSEDEAATFAQLAATLAEVSSLHRNAERQRRDLLDSHRALVSMHAEIDDKNDALRRAADVKSRVVTNVSHEFRTPINSILGITQLLLDRLDGDLTNEQEKQLRFVRTSAESLSELVNDLLDLSRIEAGRHELRVSKTSADELLSSLRGMMQPLAKGGVAFVVEDPPPGVPPLETDAGKVSQILRNLTSNALKFTESGEVRVRLSMPIEGRVRVDVTDTGIGIAPEDRERIFDEFVQIDNDIQRRVRGTGLGLALSRRLAEFLGGTLTVQSRVGQGSTFTLDVPLVHAEVSAVKEISAKSVKIDPSRVPILVVEDNRQTIFFYERYLSNAGFQVLPARSIDEARKAIERVRPSAIVLDVMLEGESTWGFLRSLKEDPATHDIPVMVVTVVDRAQQARALGADEFWLKPIDGERLIRKLAALSKRGNVAHVLVIDDDEAARYLVRKLLSGAPYAVLEAATAGEGVRLARQRRPDVILLDFVLGNETAFDVIDDLKADADTRNIPIILQTAKTLDEVERARLERETASIVKKESISREVAIGRIREALEVAGIRAVRPA
ncbi:MAG: response regulator [Deltaproteobacteria bacterium]|nr:response regulator [Deltaproteobacteria bacterium]